MGVLFGIFWTIMAVAITRDAPFPMVKIFFPLFGVVFVVMGIVNVVYNARNATAKNRFSEFDITSHDEELDPFNERLMQSEEEEVDPDTTLSARLSEVEELKEKGLISEDEYFEQRERILNEI